MVLVDRDTVDDDVLKVLHRVVLFRVQVTILSGGKELAELGLLLGVEVVKARMVLVDRPTVSNDIMQVVIVVLFRRTEHFVISVTLIFFDSVALEPLLLFGNKVVPARMVLVDEVAVADDVLKGLKLGLLGRRQLVVVVLRS